MKIRDYCVSKSLRLSSFAIHGNPNGIVKMVVGKELQAHMQGYVVIFITAEYHGVLGQ